MIDCDNFSCIYCISKRCTTKPKITSYNFPNKAIVICLTFKSKKMKRNVVY